MAGAVIGLILSLILLPIVILYETWVASLAWEWFMIPLGFPELSFWMIAGVLVTIQIFFPSNTDHSTSEEGAFIQPFNPLINATLLLAIAWVIHSFFL